MRRLAPATWPPRGCRGDGLIQARTFVVASCQVLLTWHPCSMPTAPARWDGAAWIALSYRHWDRVRVPSAAHDLVICGGIHRCSVGGRVHRAVDAQPRFRVRQRHAPTLSSGGRSPLGGRRTASGHWVQLGPWCSSIYPLG